MNTVVAIVGPAGHQYALPFGDTYAMQLFTDRCRALDFLSTEAAAHVAFIVVDASVVSPDGTLTEEIRRRFPRLPVLMLLPQGRTESEAEVLAPVREEQVSEGEACVALETNGSCESSDGDLADSESVCVHSEWRERIRVLLPQVATSDAPVLLQGETGVGKEVIARSLHAKSQRAHKPFVKVNCAALPSELVESELFGYERGAFTGAIQQKPGKFELASTGTVFLDEIGDMDVRLQAKLLQVLQDQTFDRLGGRQVVRVNVRVIAATHCDLEMAVRAGRFRRDLYYRLNVITICVPALRDRREEILPLCEQLLIKHAPAGVLIPKLPHSLKHALVAYDWPGNVRELENILRRLLIVKDPKLIEHDLCMAQARKHEQSADAAAPSQRVSQASPASHHASSLGQLEYQTRSAEASSILAALEASRWNRGRAATVLGISYKTLLYRMRKHGLHRNPADGGR